MFSFIANYYYLTIVLQAICVIHCVRKGTQQKWIWLIVFLPVVGCLIYLYSEVFTHRDIEKVQSNLGSVFNPSGKIKKLEENLRFADTFTNRISLADAYLFVGESDRAIELYEKSLVGNFKHNEHASIQLIIAYYNKNRFNDIITKAKEIVHLPQFKLSRAHMYYAIALGKTGDHQQAENEFNAMKARFSNYECRYYFGKFLLDVNRQEDAKNLFKEMISEVSHLTSKEKRNNLVWINKAKETVKQI
jgi:hypothetical protein